jgi:heme oxygenase
MSGLRDRLRTETAAAHEQLEGELNLIRPDLELSDYISLLERFYGFYIPLERQVAATLGNVQLEPFFKQRIKRGYLIADLTHFGHAFNMLSELPLAEVPQLTTLADVVGAMYVTEGATLGGQVIVKHVGKHLGLSAARGCSFFASYGDDVGPMWRSYCAFLEMVSQPVFDDNVVETANEIFSSMQRWLCPVEAAA